MWVAGSSNAQIASNTHTHTHTHAYRVFPTEVLDDLYLIEVEGSLETVRRLEFGGPRVGHALVVAGGRVVRVRVEYCHNKSAGGFGGVRGERQTYRTDRL
jgi:hypothetical protein